ncbi:EAL domain-containing protein [Ferrimonas sediminicola]|uniref:EAL domain-containing protein n=1 Tax=Ferrimonas sediminicola TaxID=2569538 RepID=A0A4U1BGA4_9GAMM|nr:EAL domain-containing protein [Ferrimonas sediminicola]TKB49041.1 EAL domain-containing protein [Ferrimonas sediminicola]
MIQIRWQLGRYLRHGWQWFILIQLACLLGVLLAGGLALSQRLDDRVDAVVDTTENYLSSGIEALARLGQTLDPGVCDATTEFRLTEAAIHSEVFDHFAYLSDEGGYCRSATNPLYPIQVGQLMSRHPGPLWLAFDDSTLTPYQLFVQQMAPGHYLVGMAKSAHLLEKLLSSRDRDFIGQMSIRVDGRLFYAQDRLDSVPWLSLQRTRSLERVSAQVVGLPLCDSHWRRWLSYSLPLSLALGLVLPALIIRHHSHKGVLVDDLTTALKRGEIAPVFQPIVDGGSGRVRGFEMMARWHHPNLGQITPDTFIPIMERHGLLDSLLTSLADQARGKLPDATYLSINLSGEQLTHGLRDPISFLLEICHRLRIGADRLMVEITERQALDYDCPQLQETLALLRHTGFKLAFDDFGTGYNGIACLRTFSPDVIKIDKSYVQTINGEAIQRPVLEAIIQLSRQMGVEVIAEGVETEAQRRFLLDRGVTSMQGYLFGRPARWHDSCPLPQPAIA